MSLMSDLYAARDLLAADAARLRELIERLPGEPLRCTTDFVALPGRRYDVDTTAGPITATLDLAPAEGDAVEFNDAAGTWSTHAFTVDPNGQQFEDAGDGSNPADPMTCDDAARFVLIFAAGRYRPR